MNITCPSCNTSYAVDAASFPADGRAVRCARCKEVWHAIAYQPAATILPPEPDGPDEAAAGAMPVPSVATAASLVAEPQGAQIIDDGAEIGAAPEPADIEKAAEARARLAARSAAQRPKARHRNRGNPGLAALIAAAFVAIGYAGVHYREDVVRALPSSAGLYALIGMPVNLRGLEFAGVTQRRDFEDGVPVLIVEGEIVNVRDRATPVPALRFALRGKGGDEIYAWTMEPRQRVVEPAASMGFRTRLASPPRGADNVQVRFSERDRRVVERTQ